MQAKKIAIISDIHGNSWALRAVLRDINQRNIKTTINLGDTLHGPLDPKGTFDLIQKHEIISISGNGDRLILENLDRPTNSASLEAAKQSMTHKTIGWLKQLPFDLIYKELIYCCHASPKSDTEPLLESIKADGVTIRDHSEIAQRLKQIGQQIVLCGHTHVPRLLKTDKHLIVNPGSVGLPAYDDEQPVYHKMESLSPHARYTVLRFENGEVLTDQIAVPYDYEKAAVTAEKNNCHDWTKWLRTGRA